MREILNVWRRRARCGLIAHLPARATIDPVSHVKLLGASSLSWIGRRDG